MMQTHLEDLIATLQRSQALLPAVAAAGAEIRQALRSGHKLLTAGNGGSAADALHLAEELVGRFDKERVSLPAIALCADPTLLTCIGNDYGFEQLFSRQVEGLGRPGDVLVIFSTSGQSPNLVAALHTARARQLKTIAVLGKDGGAARGLADHELIVPSNVPARIQEVHTFILHSWLTLVEADF
jgi:D-sedoheptulose 7-phosphate isomerase